MIAEKSRLRKFLNHFQLEFGEEDGKRNNNNRYDDFHSR